MNALLAIAVAAPAATSLGLLAAGGRALARPSAAGHVATAASAVAFSCAVGAAVGVAVSGPIGAAGSTVGALGPWGLTLNGFTAVFLLLVTGLGAVVQAFAVRYLRGDRRAVRFALLTGALVTCIAATLTAVNLIVLAIAWTATGLVMRRLVGLSDELPAARAGVRSATRAFVVSDVALWTAVAITTATWGLVDLRTLADETARLQADGTALSIVAGLLVVAAAARSALVPLHDWLTDTLAAPTPVSALLHAGVVNGGGMLLIVLSPLFGASALATHLAFALGAVSVVVGTTLMLVRPDVKGSLALSTVGQMGFTVMVCGLGAYAAAAFHLVAHGMYKASLFLASGSAVDRHVRHRQAPPAPSLGQSARYARRALAIGLPVVALAGADALLPALPKAARHETSALLLFAWATLTWTGLRWLATATSPLAIAAYVGATVGAAVAYVGALHALEWALTSGASGAASASASPWLLLPLLAALAAVAALRGPRGAGAAPAAADALYVAALNASMGLERPRPSSPTTRAHSAHLVEGIRS